MEQDTFILLHMLEISRASGIRSVKDVFLFSISSLYFQHFFDYIAFKIKHLKIELEKFGERNVRNRNPGALHQGAR